MEAFRRAGEANRKRQAEEIKGLSKKEVAKWCRREIDEWFRPRPEIAARVFPQKTLDGERLDGQTWFFLKNIVRGDLEQIEAIVHLSKGSKRDYVATKHAVGFLRRRGLEVPQQLLDLILDQAVGIEKVGGSPGRPSMAGRYRMICNKIEFLNEFAGFSIKEAKEILTDAECKSPQLIDDIWEKRREHDRDEIEPELSPEKPD